jgi:hypothetical protein
LSFVARLQALCRAALPGITARRRFLLQWRAFYRALLAAAMTV